MNIFSIFKLKSKKEEKISTEETKNANKKVKTEERTISKSPEMAKKIASECGLEFFPNIYKLKIESQDNPGNLFLASNNQYISLHPANDGKPHYPFEWFGKFGEKEEFILDNQQSFKEITNISEILRQIVGVYKKYIDQEEIIDWRGFAIKLEDNVTPEYIGKASLVVTDKIAANYNVKPGLEEKAKLFLINEFIDHFIGWNFGVAINNDEELENDLLEYNKIIIEKGLRKAAGPGIRVWESEDVQHYKFLTEL